MKQPWVYIDGWGSVPSQLFDLRPNNGGGDEDNGNLLQKVLCIHCHTQCPRPCNRPPPTHASTIDSWTLAGKSGSVSCGVTAHFSWVLVCTGFSLCPPRVCFHRLCKFWWLYGGVIGDLLQEGLCHTQVQGTQSPFPKTGHRWPSPPQETLKHSNVGLAQCLWGLLVHTSFSLSPLSISGGFDSKCNFTPPIILLGLFVCP